MLLFNGSLAEGSVRAPRRGGGAGGGKKFALPGVVLGPGRPPSLGRLLEMQSLSPHLGLQNQALHLNEVTRMHLTD